MKSFLVVMILCIFTVRSNETSIDQFLNSGPLKLKDNGLFEADSPEELKSLLGKCAEEQRAQYLENYLTVKFDDIATFELGQYSPQIECIKLALIALSELASIDDLLVDAGRSFIAAGNVNIIRTFFKLGLLLSNMLCVPPIVATNQIEMFYLLKKNALGTFASTMQVMRMIKLPAFTPAILDKLIEGGAIPLELPCMVFQLGWLEKAMKKGRLDLAHALYRRGARLPNRSRKITFKRRESISDYAEQLARYLSKWECYKIVYMLNMALCDASSTLSGLPVEIVLNNIGQWLLSFEDIPPNTSHLYEPIESAPTVLL